MNTGDYIGGYIERAAEAQRKAASLSQKQLDSYVRAVGKVVYDNAEMLAEMAVNETGMGLYEDKVLKNRAKPSIIWNSLKGKPSVGIIRRDEAAGIVEVAKPVGIVAAITPCTNPIVTPMCNAMFAVKGGNAVIITPHHRAIGCSTKTVELINRELAGLGAPENLIQILDQQSRENTRELISACDVVVATGGMGMVKAAYSSGKPAFGVGAGNVQCIIDRGQELSAVVPKIVTGRCFDNGIICSAEQSVIVHEDDYAACMDEFRKNGAYVVEDSREASALRAVLFPEGRLSGTVIGQAAVKIAAAAGLDVPEGTRLLLVRADGAGAADILSREKMCPVMSVYTWTEFDQAVATAAANLELEGAGHSVAIHSDNTANIEKTALALPASRFVVNQTSSTSAGGSFYNGFAPTTTLGCGSWGNNSISENLSYKHLINISRIGHYMPDNPVPSAEELWEG